MPLGRQWRACRITWELTPSTALYERWMFGLNTRLWEPMVVDVSGGAADILGAIGPIYLPQYQRTVTAHNVGGLIDYYHHHNNAQTDTQSQRFLAVLLHAVLARVQTLSPRGLLAFAGGLHNAISDQSLLMYDRRAAVESAIRESGAAGAVLSPPNDSLFIVDDNLSYNKINPYVREAATYDVLINKDLRPEATLAFCYHVVPSPASVFGIGPNFGLAGTKHDYQNFIRIYVPPGSQMLGATGMDSWATTPANGRTQLAGRILGARRTNRDDGAPVPAPGGSLLDAQGRDATFLRFNVSRGQI